MAEVVFGTYVVKKRNTKSKVWQYFGLGFSEEGVVVDKEQDKPVCQMCSRSVQAKTSNTTNLFQHLREHHPSVYAEVAQKKPERSVQRTLSEVTAKSSKYSSSSILPCKRWSTSVNC